MSITPAAITYTVHYLQQQDKHNQHSIRTTILHTMDLAPYVQQAINEQPDSFRASLIAAMQQQPPLRRRR